MMNYACFVLLFVSWQAVQCHVVRNKKGATGIGCSSINLISRAQWKARAPKNTTDIKVPVSEFFVHHTASYPCFNFTACAAAVRAIQDFHMDTRGWYDIGYSFLVGQDGNVYEGRGWKYVGAHTKGFNSKSFGTSVIGNFMSILPNDKALTALQGIIACGVELGKISPQYRLFGHRDAGKTDCPGDALYKLIKGWSHYGPLPPMKKSNFNLQQINTTRVVFSQ